MLCTGCVAGTVGVGEATIVREVREQEERDRITGRDRLSGPGRQETGIRLESNQGRLRRAVGESSLKGRS